MSATPIDYEELLRQRAAQEQRQPLIAAPPPANSQDGYVLPGITAPKKVEDSPRDNFHQIANNAAAGAVAQQPKLEMPESKPQIAALNESTPEEPSPLDMAKTERNRIVNTGSGISQIHSKIENSEFGKNHGMLGKILGWGAEIPARIADIGLSTVAPQIAVNVPGTEYHHRMLVNQANKQVNQDEGNEKSEAATAASNAEVPLRQAETRKTIAEADEAENPTPKAGRTPEEQTYYDLLGQKNPDTGKNYTHVEALKAVAQTKQDVKPEKPEVQPHITYDSGIPVSVTGPKGTYDVNDPKLPEEFKPLVQAATRAHSQRTKETADAQARSFAHSDAARADTQEHNDNKTPKPNADEQRRADLSENLNENLKTLEDIVNRRPELFGPLHGRMTGIKAFIGSNDPDIGSLETIKHQLGMAQISAHGMRSAQGIEGATTSILNGFKNGPDAVKASINAARNSVKTFTNDVTQGSPKRETPNAQSGGPKEGDTKVNRAGITVKFAGGKWGPA